MSFTFIGSSVNYDLQLLLLSLVHLFIMTTFTFKSGSSVYYDGQPVLLQIKSLLGSFVNCVYNNRCICLLLWVSTLSLFILFFPNINMYIVLITFRTCPCLYYITIKGEYCLFLYSFSLTKTLFHCRETNFYCLLLGIVLIPPQPWSKGGNFFLYH